MDVLMYFFMHVCNTTVTIRGRHNYPSTVYVREITSRKGGRKDFKSNLTTMFKSQFAFPRFLTSSLLFLKAHWWRSSEGENLGCSPPMCFKEARKLDVRSHRKINCDRT